MSPVKNHEGIIISEGLSAEDILKLFPGNVDLSLAAADWGNGRVPKTPDGLEQLMQKYAFSAQEWMTIARIAKGEQLLTVQQENLLTE